MQGGLRLVSKALNTIDQVIDQGPFRASWDSLQNYKVPRWYEDAKFGIFIHWGVYSVPAFGNEWYPRQMYCEDKPEFQHHLKTYGPQRKFGYKDFIPMFKAEKWDPHHWADLFRKAGAKFVMPVAEHHDGFAMYDCGFHNWTSVKMGPRRDIVGELAAAVRKEGLVFSCSTHREEHWWFFDGGMKFDSDVRDSAYRSLYGPAHSKDSPPDKDFLDEWLAIICELVDKYQPQIVWFDWWINTPAYQPYLQRFAAYYYNRAAQWGVEVAINYKEHAFREGSAVFDMERGQLADIRPMFWQTDTSISKNSWGYVSNQDYKTAGSIIGDLIDIASKNGALLLNIGPKPDGTIPEAEESILLEIGKWLDVNGEAIYSTRPWKKFGEGPTQVVEGAFNDVKRGSFTSEDIRFTTKENVLYAIALAWPESGKLVVQSLGENTKLAPNQIANVTMLGCEGKLPFSRNAGCLVVDLPASKPCDHAFALRVEFDG
jgi:alpha-L-fucosidase